MARLETIDASTTTDTLAARAEALGAVFASRAAHLDATDTFAAENFADLKAAGFLEAAVPAELGGGGAEPSELADMLRRLARHCGSTALALAMHTHQVAIPRLALAPQGRDRRRAALEGGSRPNGSCWFRPAGRTGSWQRRGAEGRQWLSHHRPQGLFFSLAGRRPPDDRAILRGSDGEADEVFAFCGATRLAARGDPRHLA